MGKGISVVQYCRDEAAGKEALPSRANALQARREASDFCQSLQLRRAKNLLSLPSLAAQLRACVYPFTLHPQVAAKKKCTSGLVLASPVGFTWGFFPFCQVRYRSPHKPAPQEGEIVPFGHKLPRLPRPDGACLLDICVCRQNVRACGGFPACTFVG